MSNTKTSRTGSVVAFLLSGLFIVAAAWLFLNKQYALDQLAVWSYEPSSNVQSISERIGLTDKGEFTFYATKPAIEAQASFNKECPRQEAGSPILGCYTNDDRIYVYDLTNEQLDGMEEVTAAHEMLHAVWYRTSDADKAKLEKSLHDAYAKVTNEELKKRMDYYERTEPGEFYNELHSILGTEVASLGEPLESYYAQFFNRAAVLALHEKYSAVYDALYQRADELYTKMQELSTSIEARSSAYDAAARQLSTDITTFNNKASNGGFTSQTQFNSERFALVRRSQNLEAERQAINNDIVTYNDYYTEYQDISKEIEVLNNSIDSFKQLDQGPSV